VKAKIFNKKSTKTTTTGMEKKVFCRTKRKTQAVSLAVKLRQQRTKQFPKAGSGC